ncbi:hypothetical protein [Brenneria tiliae]|uniref:hypothetical protein n=1 Tax=Brenneria tiliae TaxID=2914984 RepID=UPI002014EA00|nr:hypothetical protein [Brenneria tiliae]MCL2897396.1 hypothetical protein [Brenneria tiliae]MCL2901661.1 hypothetical protein [Brenneria tiliae]
MDFNNNYDFPVTSAFTQDEMQEKFWKCLYTSSDKNMLHYWVILPKRVKPAELTPINFPDVGLTNIGRYITADSSPYLEVWAAYERCPWEMNAADWLFKKLSIMGEKVLHQRIINNPAGSGTFADVLTIKTHASGDEVVSRYTVQKDYNPVEGGGNYFLLKASVASRDYSELANDIHFIVVNWDLLHRSNLALAELLTTVPLSNDMTSSFKIPASWQAKTIANNRLVIEHTINDINYGVINLYLYAKSSSPTPEDVYNKSTARFQENNNSVSLVANEIEPIPNDINASLGEELYTCTGEIFSAEENMRALYQMYIFSCADLWCYVELVGQHKNNKNYHFEVNKRCMEILLTTFHMVRSVKSGL